MGETAGVFAGGSTSGSSPEAGDAASGDESLFAVLFGAAADPLPAIFAASLSLNWFRAKRNPAKEVDQSRSVTIIDDA